MSKTKALLCGILSGAGLIGFILVKELTGIVAFAAGSVLFIGIWFAKYQRDRNIVRYARKQRACAQVAKTTSPSNNRSSNLLFDRKDTPKITHP